ncbi:MAG: hypothetical protein ACK5IQ_07600 [Bacteroidales bacterium]
MIDRDNRKFMEEQDGMDYILGDRIKNLPKTVLTLAMTVTKL